VNSSRRIFFSNFILFFAKMKEENVYCDVFLAKTCGLHPRMMGVSEDHGNIRGAWEYQGSMGISEEHGRGALY
jgi:hypothetical protein